MPQPQATIRSKLTPFERVERCIRNDFMFKAEDRRGHVVYLFKRGTMWGRYTHDSLIACVEEAETVMRREGIIE